MRTMHLKGAGVLLAVLALCGCHHGAPVADALPAAPSVAAVDPERRLYEQVRTGAYQLNGALENLQTAEEMAKKLAKAAGGTAASGFSDLMKKLDAAGEDLADYTADVPEFDEFKENISEQDDRRLNAIDDSNDALGYIADGQDIVDDLLAGAPDDVKPQVQKIQDQLDGCVDDIESAIVGMGGKVDNDNETPQAGKAPPNGAG